MSCDNPEAAKKYLDSCVLQFGEDHSATIAASFQLAHAYRTAGRTEAAGRTLLNRLLHCRKPSNPQHYELLKKSLDVALTLQDSGHFGLAREMQDEVLTILIDVAGPDADLVVIAMEHLDNTLLLMKDGDALRLLRERRVMALRESLGDNAPQVLTALFQLADSCWRLQDFQEALRLDEQVLAAYQIELGEQDKLTLQAHFRVFRDLVSVGRFRKARQHLKDALAVAKRTLEVQDSVRVAFEQWNKRIGLLGFGAARYYAEIRRDFGAAQDRW